MLGHGDTEDCTTPKAIEALAAHTVTQVAAGDYHSLVVTAGGAVFSFGNGGVSKLSNSAHESCVNLCLLRVDTNMNMSTHENTCTQAVMCKSTFDACTNSHTSKA